MILRRALMVLLVTPALAGCITYSNLDRRTSLDDLRGDAIVVIGVDPRYRIHVTKGSVAGELWSASPAAFVTLNVFPEGGYVVGRVPARSGNEGYYVGAILPEGIGISVPMYGPCNGDSAATFEAPAGTVTYVGNIAYGEAESTLAVTYSNDFEAAKKYMTTQYPHLADAMVGSEMKVREVTNFDCTAKGVPIVVYIVR